MTLLITVLLILLAVGAVVALFVGWRQRQTGRGSRFETIDKRLVQPPPSPYTPSQGFRMLDGPNAAPRQRPEPARPRLEDAREYVFSDSQAAPLDDNHFNVSRHNTKWALERSVRHRPRRPTGRRLVVLVVLAVVVIVGAGYYLQHSPSTTTTTKVTTTTAG